MRKTVKQAIKWLAKQDPEAVVELHMLSKPKDQLVRYDTNGVRWRYNETSHSKIALAQILLGKMGVDGRSQTDVRAYVSDVIIPRARQGLIENPRKGVYGMWSITQYQGKSTTHAA